MENPKAFCWAASPFHIFHSFLRSATNNILALAFLIYVSLHATFYILQFTYTHLLLSHITSLLFIVLNSAQSKVCKCFTNLTSVARKNPKLRDIFYIFLQIGNNNCKCTVCVLGTSNINLMLCVSNLYIVHNSGQSWVGVKGGDQDCP